MSETKPGLDAWAIAALCYLAAPALVFVVGWLQAPYSIGAGLTLVFLLVRTSRGLNQPSAAGDAKAMIYLAAIALIWSSFSGAGHLVHASTDWPTRDAVYADLIRTAWPPMYAMDAGVPVILRSAIGYFLPPAWIASGLGIDWAAAILLLWTALGVFLFLVLLPLPRKAGPMLVLASLCVIGFSGMDYAAIVLLHGHLPIFPLTLEWWAPWTYTSLTGQFLWAPNHALALWIGTALYFRYRNDPSLVPLGLLALPLLLLWTPFAIIGLLPFLCLSMVRNRLVMTNSIREIRLAQWLGLGLLAYLVVRYMTTAAMPEASLPPAAHVNPLTLAQRPPTLLTAFEHDSVLRYAAFVLFEFLLLALVLWRGVTATLRPEMALAVAMLMLLPVFRFGPSNDLLLRASTPSLLLLLIALLDVLQRGAYRCLGFKRLAMLTTIVVVGMITPLHELVRALAWPRSPPNYSQNLLDQQGGHMAAHYFGRLEGSDLTRMFRSPQPVPISVPPKRTMGDPR